MNDREQRERAQLRSQRKAFMRFARLERDKLRIAQTEEAKAWHRSVIELNIAFAKINSRHLREYFH